MRFTQCSSFLSAQPVKEFFKLVEHLQAIHCLIIIMSAQCIICNGNLSHFSPFFRDRFYRLLPEKKNTLYLCDHAHCLVNENAEHKIDVIFSV